MSRILVSACLLGSPVRYDGRSKTLTGAFLDRWRAEDRLVPLCPEIAAGLPTPRAPAEIAPGDRAGDVFDAAGRILTDEGEDVTGIFRRGAEIALRVAQDRGCRFALLTDGSPSCGSLQVYAGHHDGTRRPGRGVVTELLERHGIQVFAPRDIALLAQALA